MIIGQIKEERFLKLKYSKSISYLHISTLLNGCVVFAGVIESKRDKILKLWYRN